MYFTAFIYFHSSPTHYCWFSEGLRVRQLSLTTHTHSCNSLWMIDSEMGIQVSIALCHHLLAKHSVIEICRFHFSCAANQLCHRLAAVAFSPVASLFASFSFVSNPRRRGHLAVVKMTYCKITPWPLLWSCSAVSRELVAKPLDYKCVLNWLEKPFCNHRWWQILRFPLSTQMNLWVPPAPLGGQSILTRWIVWSCSFSGKRTG